MAAAGPVADFSAFYADHAERVLVFLAVPRGGNRRSVRTRQGPSGTASDYWLMSVPAVHPDARLRWFDRHGHTAGRRLVLPASHAWEHAPRRARP